MTRHAGLALLGILGGSGLARAADSAKLFANRLDPAALDQALAGFAEAAGRAPNDPEPRLLLARAESFWPKLHADAAPGDALPHLARGVQAAREALRLTSPGYAEAARQGFGLAQALQVVEPAGAAALYWLGENQHQLATQRGLSALLLEVDDLRRIFARVIELAPETFHGAAYLHQAELSLALPAGYAATLGTAADALAQAQRLGPSNLWVDLVWAERWAVKAQDYGVFRRKLQLVIEGLGADPDLQPENELAKRRAQTLQKSAQLLFTRAAIQRGEVATGGAQK